MYLLILQRGHPFSGPVATGPVNENYVSDTTPEEILITLVAIILIAAFLFSRRNRKRIK